MRQVTFLDAPGKKKKVGSEFVFSRPSAVIFFFFHTAVDEPQFSTQPETTFGLKSLEHAGLEHAGT